MVTCFAFGALMLLVGQKEGPLACVFVLWWW